MTARLGDEGAHAG